MSEAGRSAIAGFQVPIRPEASGSQAQREVVYLAGKRAANPVACDESGPSDSAPSFLAIPTERGSAAKDTLTIIDRFIVAGGLAIYDGYLRTARLFTAIAPCRYSSQLTLWVEFTAR